MVAFGQGFPWFPLQPRPLLPALGLEDKSGVEPGPVQDAGEAVKVHPVAAADLFKAQVLVEEEIEELPDRPPVVADVPLSFFLSAVDFPRFPQNKFSFPIPLIAGGRNAAVKPSCLLFRLDASLHPRDDFLLLLCSDDAQKGGDEPLIVVGEVNHLRQRDDLYVVLNEDLLDTAEVLQIIRPRQPVKISDQDRVKSLCCCILEQAQELGPLLDPAPGIPFVAVNLHDFPAMLGGQFLRELFLCRQRKFLCLHVGADPDIERSFLY
ncbi:MAG TPA: hypothetical protein VNN77_06945 [candidate division Zixibacteria bacterium]|nr:hypothetical protein [candidate division Zixibacteria bacterium]